MTPDPLASPSETRRIEMLETIRMTSEVADARSAFPKLSLYFFASTDHYEAADYYHFVLSASVLADRMGLEAVWIPERHFVPFGGFSPNPAILASAIAARTERIRIRAGSVAAPLHNAVRIAEEWAVIDCISKGRVGLSFATGWNATDFVLAASSHSSRREVTARQLDSVRALWRGESLDLPDPDGNLHKVSLSLRPVSPTLPLWFTAAGSHETFELAGRLGVGVMSALFGQTLRQLRSNIERYRIARHDAGIAGPGHVVVMVHGCVSNQPDLREQIRPSMKEYLSSYSAQTSTNRLPDEVANMAFEDYFDGPSLLGTPQKSTDVLKVLGDAGADEVGVLVDFGLPHDFVLSNLRNLADLVRP